MTRLLSLLATILICSSSTYACADDDSGGNNNDVDAAVQTDAGVQVDAEVPADAEILCGNGTCDEAAGEDCDGCLADCRGIACSAVVTLSATEYREQYYKTPDFTLVDMRSETDCGTGRIPGAVACSAVSNWWDGTDIIDAGAFLVSEASSTAAPLIFYGTAAGEADVLAAAEAAVALTFSDVYVIDSGIDGWRSQSWFEWISTGRFDQLYYPPPAGVYLVDTRDATLFAECHHRDWVHVFLGDFWDGSQPVNGGMALTAVAPDPANAVLVVRDDDSARAAEAMGYRHALRWIWDAWDDEYQIPVEGPMCVVP